MLRRNFAIQVAGLLPLKTTAGFLIVAVGFLVCSGAQGVSSQRLIVVAVTFNSRAIKLLWICRP